MMKMKKFFTTAVIFAFMAGCANQGGPNQAGGTLIGGATGALVGSQFGKGDGRLVGVAIGTLLGAAVGGDIGRSMDQQDRAMAARTAQRALESSADNQVSTWQNPNKSHSGNFVVTRTQEYAGSNQVCRDFVHTVIIDGQQEKMRGRACRDVRDPKAAWIMQQ